MISEAEGDGEAHGKSKDNIKMLREIEWYRSGQMHMYMCRGTCPHYNLRNFLEDLYVYTYLPPIVVLCLTSHQDKNYFIIFDPTLIFFEKKNTLTLSY